MNLLLTTDAFPPGAGGSGRSTATLARALARRKHHVRVVVGRNELQHQTEWHGVAVSEVEIPKARFGSRGRERALAAGLASALGEEGWDLVHAQHWLSATATRSACPRLPMIVTVRDYWPICIWSTQLSGTASCPGCSYARRVACVGRRRPFLWPLTPVLPPFVGAELARRVETLKAARAVVAVSEHVSNLIPGDETHVIPNFLERERRDPPPPDDVPERYVLFVGKLEPNKAPDRLLPILEASGRDVPLLIAGSGSLSSELSAQAKRSGRDIRLLGWVDEDRVLRLMRHAAAVLFPSRWHEPLSRVLVDGLGVGAVLVVEPTGGSEDVVVHDESGLLGRSVNELGAALARVLDDDSLAERLRNGARARADAVFSEDVVVPRVEALYRRVAAP